MRKLAAILRPSALRELPIQRRLDVWMAYHGLRQEEAAELCGVTQGTFAAVVRGLRVSRPVMEELSALSGIPVDALQTSAARRSRG